MNFNTLWIGQSLSNLEILALTSHLKVGHTVVLWSYSDVSRIPDGVIVKDAREIMPENQIFTYQVGEGTGSYSACSNLFRYKLLYDQGGWWIDTDVVALKRFDFDEPYVFASETIRSGAVCPTTCVIKVPVGSDVMKRCWDMANQIDRQTVKWGTIGPKLLTSSVFYYGLEEYSVSPSMFCPIDWLISEQDPIVSNYEIPDCHAVHLWQEMWRRKHIDKDGTYDKDCLYERLKNAIL